MQPHAAATLSDALAPAVGESDDTRGMPAPARARDVHQTLLEDGQGQQPLVKGGVHGHHGRLEREAPGKVQDGPRYVGDRVSADRLHLVVTQTSDVGSKRAGRLARGPRTACDMHLVEGSAPERQAEEDRC